MRTPFKCGPVTVPSFTATLMEWAQFVAFMRYDLIRMQAAKAEGDTFRARMFNDSAKHYGRLAQSEWKHAKKEASHV